MPGALLEDLGVRGFEGVFGVECAFPPGRFLLGVLCCQVRCSLEAAGGCGIGHRSPGFGVGVEERAGDARSPGDCGDGDRGLLPAHPGEHMVNTLVSGLCGDATSLERGCGLWFVPAVGDVLAHAFTSAGSPCPALGVSSSWLLPALARSEARNAVFQTRWK